jgi:5-methylcytosine-specific restriction endonuclease McrA
LYRFLRVTSLSRGAHLPRRRPLGPTIRRAINEHIADVHRRVLRRDEFELVCECGDCELEMIRVPEHVYHAARADPGALLVDPEHVQDAEVVAHHMSVTVVRRQTEDYLPERDFESG